MIKLIYMIWGMLDPKENDRQEGWGCIDCYLVCRGYKFFEHK